MPADSQTISKDPRPARSGRLISLDALRGFDMFWIIGGSEVFRAVGRMTRHQWINDQMEHVAWAGLRLHDVIFPLFIFIMGVSMVFSLGKTIRESGRAIAVRRILRRSVLLYALGFIASGGFSNAWPQTHLAGVLNRISAAYLFAGLIFCAVKWRGMLAAAILILGGYWAVMTFAPMRDIRLDKASLENKGILPMGIFLGTTNWTHGKFEQGYNVANQIDFLYLPGFKGHGYYDPDGLLTTLPVIVTCLLGVFAGLLLQSGEFCDKWKLIYLVSLGAAGILIGLLWSLQFPIIKRLWSPSFVLVTGGISSIALAIFYWVVDVKQYRFWCQPFVWIGMNSIAIYFSTSIIDYTKLGARLVGQGELLPAIAGTLLAIGLCRYLYRRKIFLKI